MTAVLAGTPDARIPITLVTGYLGSGKSTVINRFLATAKPLKVAVVVNEFGEVPIDHLLMAQGADQVVELPNGCLCCAVRSDLTTTLFGLYAARVEGSISAFDHVVIETSGAAEPGPVLRLLYADEAIARRFRVAAVLTVVDAVHGEITLAEDNEAEAQVAAADRIAITKTDLVDAATLRRLTRRLEDLAEGAGIRRITRRSDMRSLIIDDAGRGETVAHTDMHHHAHHDRCSHDAAPPRYQTAVRIWPEPIGWRDFARWAGRLGSTGDRRLLRIKGLVKLSDHPERPLIFHAVQGVAHPPEFLPAWPSKDQRSRLIFITRDLPKGRIDELCAALTAPRHDAMLAQAGESP